MSSNIVSIGHASAFDLVQSKVLDLVDGGDAVGIQDVSSVLVAGVGVELFAPGSLNISGTEPLGKGHDSLGLLSGTAFLIQNAQILSNVVGAVVDLDQCPVLGLHGALQRNVGAFGCGIDLAVQGGGVEGGNLDIALVQRNEAVLVVVAAGLAVSAVVPQGLPALDADTASGRSGIGEGVQDSGVDVGVGGAADLVLTVPGVAAVNNVSPVLEVQSLAIGAVFIGTVQHQDVLDNQTVGLAVVLVLANSLSPGGSPVNDGQVLVLAVHDLSPTGLVQTKQDVAVLVLVGSLDGSSVTGDNGVVIDGNSEAGFLGFLNQPQRTLGGVGVGVNTDGVAGVVLDFLHRLGFRNGSFGFHNGRFAGTVKCGTFVLVGAGNQTQNHGQSQQQSKQFLHNFSLLISVSEDILLLCIISHLFPHVGPKIKQIIC